MNLLNADLHCHSTVSDGTLEPEALAALAHAQGVALWALTDHDEISGQVRARAAAEALGLRYVNGVEISITWAGETVHIVGLGIDVTHSGLIEGLARTRSGRSSRAQDMAASLERAGIPGTYEGALKYVGNPDLISRTHFARHLVEAGVCRTTDEVFSRYLVEGCPGYVAHRWASLQDAVSWIRDAGGVAVIAHPGRYRLDAMRTGALYDMFRELGGEAIEVVTGSHTPDQYREYAEVAKRYGFLASRGSDFHGPGESRVALGSLSPLPKGLRPVWQRFV